MITNESLFLLGVMKQVIGFLLGVLSRQETIFILTIKKKGLDPPSEPFYSHYFGQIELRFCGHINRSRINSEVESEIVGLS